MPRWLARSLVILGIGVVALVVASGWLLTAPGRNVTAQRDAALALWRQAHPSHYLLRARLLSMQSGETLLLEVRDGRLVGGWSGNGSKALSAGELSRLDAFFPIERLFELAQREEQRDDWRTTLTLALPQLGPWLGVSCRPRQQIATRYDGQQGYPTRLFVGVSLCALNTDGVEVRVDELRRLP